MIRWLRNILSESTVAKKLYIAQIKQILAEGEAGDAIMDAVGIDREDPNNWPFEDMTFDWYDESFELKDVRIGYEFAPEVLPKLKKLGFAKAWLCYTDKKEKYYGF